jgi:hypothetical protein
MILRAKAILRQLSLSAVRKRKQRGNTTIFIEAEAERKANARERKWRSLARTKGRNELQKLDIPANYNNKILGN